MPPVMSTSRNATRLGRSISRAVLTRDDQALSGWLGRRSFDAPVFTRRILPQPPGRATSDGLKSLEAQQKPGGAAWLPSPVTFPPSAGCFRFRRFRAVF